MKILPEFEKSIGFLEKYDRYLDRGHFTEKEYDAKVAELASKFNLTKSQYISAVYKYTIERMKLDINWEPPKPPSEASEFLQKYYDKKKEQMEKEKADSGLNEKAFEKLAKKAEKVKKVKAKKDEKVKAVSASKKRSRKKSV